MMNILKDKHILIFNEISILINFIISIFYYFFINEMQISFLVTVNVFLLFVSNLIVYVTNKQERKQTMKLMFILCNVGLVWGIIQSFVEGSIANTYIGLVGCIYIYSNILYRLFFFERFNYKD